MTPYNLQLQKKKDMVAKTQVVIMAQPEEMNEEMCTPETCLGNLFSFRDELHLHHLATLSYATHVALNDLYNDVLDITDKLFETYQSEGLITVVIPETKICCEVMESLTNFQEYVEDMRGVFTKSYQKQILDDLDEAIAKTIYKLKFLK